MDRFSRIAGYLVFLTGVGSGIATSLMGLRQSEELAAVGPAYAAAAPNTPRTVELTRTQQLEEELAAARERSDRYAARETIDVKYHYRLTNVVIALQMLAMLVGLAIARWPVVRAFVAVVRGEREVEGKPVESSQAV